MIGYKLTIEQKESIQGVFFTDATFFNCVEDINGDWFLFLSEQDKQAFKDSDYMWLFDLPQAEYTPPPPPDFL